MQRSWIKKLFDNSFHKWKLISLHLTKSLSEKMSPFVLILVLKVPFLKGFTKYYKNVFISWRHSFSKFPNLPILKSSQFLRQNEHVNIANDSFHFNDFSKTDINFVNQLFQVEGNTQSWDHSKR